jgi:hypothetical protein
VSNFSIHDINKFKFYLCKWKIRNSEKLEMHSISHIYKEMRRNK